MVGLGLKVLLPGGEVGRVGHSGSGWMIEHLLCDKFCKLWKTLRFISGVVLQVIPEY